MKIHTFIPRNSKSHFARVTFRLVTFGWLCVRVHVFDSWTLPASDDYFASRREFFLSAHAWTFPGFYRLWASSASLYLFSEKMRLTWVIVIYGNLDWLPLNYYLWFWSFMVILSEFYKVFVIIYFPTWYSFVALLTQYSDPTQSLSSDLSTRDPAHHPLQRVLHGHIFHIQLSNSVFFISVEWIN